MVNLSTCIAVDNGNSCGENHVFIIDGFDNMGKLDKTDERYELLKRRPAIRNGRVAFRKRRNHEHKYILAMFEGPEQIHYALYIIGYTYEFGDKAPTVSLEISSQ